MQNMPIDPATNRPVDYRNILDPSVNDARNRLNTNLPQSREHALSMGYYREERDTYHKQTNSPQGQSALNNIKYVSPDGKKEVIFNNNRIVNDPVNRGTYNFFSAKTDPMLHFNYDVLPYFLFGTGSDDPSKAANRILASAGLNYPSQPTKITYYNQRPSAPTNNNTRSSASSSRSSNSNVRSRRTR